MKYTDEKIRAVRERAAAGERLAVVAREFDLSHAYVHLVVHGLRRRDAGGPIRERHVREIPQ